MKRPPLELIGHYGFPIKPEMVRQAEAISKQLSQFAIPSGIASAVAKESSLAKSISNFGFQHRLIADNWRYFQPSEFSRFYEASKLFNFVEAHRLAGIGSVFKGFREQKLLDESGWLPHHTIPDNIVANASDSEDCRTRVDAYYAEHWPEVKQQLSAGIDNYALDQESRDCFLEALEGHESGFYRSVCRLLFPEIERVTRQKFHPGTFIPISSVRSLRDQAGEIPISRRHAFEFYMRLEQHIYAHVKDEPTRAKFAADKVPNRHAAIHGHISYSSHQNSLNTILLTDFVYSVIGVGPE